MANQEEEQKLARLFSQLQVAGEDGEYERGLKIVDKISAMVPEDPDVLHCKIVCLIQCSKFSEALKMIDSCARKSGKDAPHPYLFEKAYCLYRLERYEESRKTLEGLPQDEERVRELSAQIAYRLEDYGKASAVYSSLVKQCSDDYDGERQANYAAALALAGKGDGNDQASKSEALEITSLHEETMEQCFNKACCFLAAGKGEEAEKMLKKAEELCRESLREDDYTEEEIEAELSVVRVQLACALQMQGKGKEALTMYTNVLRQKAGDSPHGIVASNNVLVLNKDRDVFDSKKKVKVLANAGTLKKLTRAQKVVILYNRSLFALHTNQLEQCRQLVSEMKSVYPTSEQTVLAEVGLFNRERKVGQAAELLDSHLKSGQAASTLLWLTLAQLYSGQGNTAMVCSVLSSLPSLSSHPGVVCTLSALHTSTGKTDAAIEVLDRAVSFWAQTPPTTPVQSLLRSIMFYNAQYKLDHNKSQGAALVLEKLHEAYPTDLKVQARLIAAYSKFDSRKAEAASQSLPEFSGAKGVNVDALEQMPSFRHTQRQQQKPDTAVKQGLSGVGGEGGSKESKKPHKKRKRKSKQPKNMDPDKKPDPERWLPLRERSYFRKGRKRGFAPLRGSQGLSHASASLTAQLDASRPKPTSTDDTTDSPRKKPEVASSPKAKPSQPQAKKKQQQKKKRKGGKW
jgi:signal recognition particle subunit SRP72